LEGEKKKPPCTAHNGPVDWEGGKKEGKVFSVKVPFNKARGKREGPVPGERKKKGGKKNPM